MDTSKKLQAIELRKSGKSYKEILCEVPVAKSTLSLWLREVGLSVPQKQRLSESRRIAALRGAHMRRDTRLRQVENFVITGIEDVGKISARELWLIGVALYWAEGSKQNSTTPSARIQFGNSDPRMIAVFLAWLRHIGLSESDIGYELYVHVNRKDDITEFKKWWASELSISPKAITRVYLKKGNPKTKRSNVGDLYHGLLRIRVKTSTILNRRISGWTEGIVAAVGSGVTGNTSAFEAEDSRIVP